MSLALIIVDIQNDFCSGGSLEVKEANEIIPIVNRIRSLDLFSLILMTQDYHPEDHISFNTSPHLNNPDLILDEVTTKWKGAFPPHCIKSTYGTEFHQDLFKNGTEHIFQKGENPVIESFSGFGNKNLNIFLQSNNIDTVYIVGLAYDFCVGTTALDSAKLGYKTYVVKDATKSISEETEKAMSEELTKNGVYIINSDSLL